jgi:hypothetical protein
MHQLSGEFFTENFERIQGAEYDVTHQYNNAGYCCNKFLYAGCYPGLPALEVRRRPAIRYRIHAIADMDCARPARPASASTDLD